MNPSSKSQASRLIMVSIVTGMLISGAGNTLFGKLQDRVCVSNCDSEDAASREEFAQPVWQTFNMFIGELLCFIVYLAIPGSKSPQKVTRFSEDSSSDQEEEPLILSSPDSSASRRRPMTFWEHLWIAIPALCDIMGTTLLNVGLISVAASVFQMLRGVVIIFTAVYSVIFLKNRSILARDRIFGLVMVFLGVSIVGASPILFSSKDASSSNSSENSDSWRAIFGTIMILLAQAIAALQFTFEESLLEKYENLPPLKMVGLEGFFGTLIMGIAMTVFYLVSLAKPSLRVGKFSVLFDMKTGIQQVIHSKALLWTSFGTIFSIAIFNFCGLNITKYVSSVARTTVDTCRTILIWLVSLSLGWENFLWLQVLGFLFVIYGTFVYNQMISPIPRSLTPECSKATPLSPRSDDGGIA